MNKPKNNSKSAFSLLELIVVVAVGSILLSISYRVANKFLLENRRSEAQAELLKLKNQLETRAIRNNSTAVAEVEATDINFTSPNEYYTIGKSGVDINNSTYNLTATAINKQAKDTNCLVLILDQNGNKSPRDCWS